MREIKFRAWDKSHKEMFFIDNIFWIKESKWVENMRLGYGELMQYTGLKDKNGKEIYEGDIINMSGANFPVTYESQSFYPSLMYLGEVIGNIYNNPELIK